MAYNPGKGAPPPQPPANKGKKHKKPKTPAQVAARSVKISQERERLTHSGFNAAWNSYNEIYQAYAGRDATRKEALALISNGVSRSILAQHLATLPSFFKSPIWAAKKDALFGIGKTLGMKVDRKFVAKAIANNWDEANFTEKLRKMPSYLQSNEFKTTTAGLTNAYRQLYGNPSAEWQHQIQKAALGRWSPTQWENYLRSQPDYVKSTEYQSNARDFRSLLGFV